MQDERTCPHCGATYRADSNYPGRKYCTAACSYAAKVARSRVERACAGCGALFVTKRAEVGRGGGKYCSRDCWRRTHPHRPMAAATIEAMREARKGAGNPCYRGDAVTIGAAHDRVRAMRGHAREHACVGCGERALDWALSRDAEVTRRATTGRRYSLNVDDYMPMCRRCHVHYDKAGSFERYFGANAALR